MAFRENSDSRIRYGRVLGLVCIVAGFVAITLGWNGAASRGCVDCQIPYLISGGMAGLSLVVFGSGLLIVAGLRAERMHLQNTLEEARGQALSVPNGGSALKAVPTGATPNGHVVVGRTTYHRPDCRLVEGKEDLDRVPVAQAEASGLSACRVCNPARADRARAAR